MPVDPLARVLRRLLVEGHVPFSSVGRRARTEIEPLFASGALSEHREGAGRRISMVDKDAVESFASSRYPAGLEPRHSDTLSPRARAVRECRDSKRARHTDRAAFLLRGFGSSAVLRTEHGEVDVGEWTRVAGAAAVMIGRDDAPRLAGTLAIVENLEFFLHLERTPVRCNFALFGRPSRSLLDWLASPPMTRVELRYCGDYDPVGLRDYTRVRDACPGRVELFRPRDLKAMFKRFGKAALIRKSERLMPGLRGETDPAVRHVVGLMDRFGVGLEQEVLIGERPPVDGPGAGD